MLTLSTCSMSPALKAQLLLHARANVSRAALLGLTVAEWRARQVTVADIDPACLRSVCEDCGGEAHRGVLCPALRHLGGPGSGWTAENGHVPGSQSGEHGASLVGGHKVELTERGDTTFVHVRMSTGSASNMGRVTKQADGYHAHAIDVKISGPHELKSDAVKAVLERSGFRAAATSSRDATPVHRAADKHYQPMFLAVMYAFLKGKKALRGSLRAAGDVEGHEFHGNQYTVSGSITDKTGKSYDVQVHQRLYPGNDVPKQEYRVVNEKGHTVASAELRREKDQVSSVYVHEQRKGIATALYNHIEKHLGYKLKQNWATTDEGSAFWKSRSAELRTAISAANISACISTIRASLLESLPPVLAKAFVAGGNAGIGMVPKRRAAMRALAPQTFGIRFDVSNPLAVKYAREHTSKIADDISQTSKDRINAAIADALEGDGLDAAYDTILDAVGDESRADMIARTESMDSANQGSLAAWSEAQDAGLLPENATKQWIAHDGACDDCDELDGEEVALDDDFSSGDDAPPAHPNCRCAIGIGTGSAE